MDELTLEEQAQNADTWKHIHRVGTLLGMFATELLERAEVHDQSKLEKPEVSIFAEYGPKLKNTTYGSEQYKAYLKEMGVALEHHYQKNPHHPEHHVNGVDDMNLFDLVEMFCDWIAAGERHPDGDIVKSIKLNKERFNLSPQLTNILLNTVEELL